MACHWRSLYQDGLRKNLSNSKVGASYKTSELYLILNFLTYYLNFTWGYAAPDLLKKNRAWKVRLECYNAFGAVKRAVIKETRLTVPGFNKPYKVRTTVNGFTIQGVLMLQGHSVAYKG